MDSEQEEMQFLGLLGIYVEAYKLITSWRKIFSQITLSLILPLSFIFLAHLEISHLLDLKISHNEFRFELSKSGTQQRKRLTHLVSSELVLLCLFKLFYFTFLIIFSLLSTSAVVYTVASAYTGREITFKKVMSVVPKVWKRLLITFLCTFLAFFVYNMFALMILILIVAFIFEDHMISGLVFFTILSIFYVLVFVYMTIIWHLASVISVLEDSYGIKAMMKSVALIKGKMIITTIVFFKLNLGMAAIQVLYDAYVIHGGRRFGMFQRMGFGILCFLMLFSLILFGLVIQTIVYFVCKSYHHESIDKSALSDHLEDYHMGDYVPLKSKDVQLEEYDV